MKISSDRQFFVGLCIDLLLNDIETLSEYKEEVESCDGGIYYSVDKTTDLKIINQLLTAIKTTLAHYELQRSN